MPGTQNIYCFSLQSLKKLYSILRMKVRTIIIILIPILLLSCTAFKPIEKLNDQELIDKYYKTDLQLYMVKRDCGYPTTPESSMKADDIQARYSERDLRKINKIERKLEIMKQELNGRGYMP